MSALTGDRTNPPLANQSPERTRQDFGTRDPAATFYVNQLLMIGTDGLISPASASAGANSVTQVCVGVSRDRTSTIIANPATISFDVGIFNFNNSTAGDKIGNGNRGQLAYAADDNTVALTDNTGRRPPCGRIDRVDATLGVFVECGLFPSGTVK